MPPGKEPRMKNADLRKHKGLWPVFGFALLLSAAVMYFCTKSSPGYAINDWCDANIYLTIGKGMTQGKVVYRDLYDHKGPLLYVLHAVAALISFQDFFGVYVVEIVQTAFFLFYCYRIIRLFGYSKSAWLLLPVIAVGVYASYSFAEGDSAEEMCLPFMAAQLYLTLRHFERGTDGPMPAGELALCGILAGCVFWIKFTVIGIPAGLALSVLLPLTLQKRWRQAFQSLGWMLLGAFLSTVPWLIYFGVNGAVYDWLKVYLGHNLILYSGTDSMPMGERLLIIARWICKWFVKSWCYTPLIVAGPLWLTLRRRRKGMAAAAWLALGVGSFFVFISAKEYIYYGLALAALVPLGMCAVAQWLEPRLEKWSAGRNRGLCAAVSVLCVALCLLSPNIRPDKGAPFGAAKADTMAYQIVSAMELDEDTTLLNFGFMDGGFYTAAGVVPTIKYFCQTNMPLPEMKEQQRSYVENELCEYVVSYMLKETLFQHYEIVAEAPSPNFWYPQVYLYRLREEYR